MPARTLHRILGIRAQFRPEIPQALAGREHETVGELGEPVGEGDVARRRAGLERGRVGRVQFVGVREAGGRILGEKEKLPRPRVADFPGKLFPVVRREAALELEHALEFGRRVHAAEVGAAVPEPAVDGDLLGGEFEEEGLALVGARGLALADGGEFVGEADPGDALGAEDLRDAGIEQVDVADERHRAVAAATEPGDAARAPCASRSRSG
jgi:hypothetical protein